MTSPRSARFEWTPQFGDEGSYPLQVIVTDGRGPSYEAPMLVTITHGNRPPVADAGGRYCNGVGGTYFDGSNSHDPEGDPLTFHWEFGDGEAADVMTVQHWYPEMRDYTATLTVSDATHTSTSTAAVTPCYPSAAEGIEAIPSGILRLEERVPHFRFRIRFSGTGASGWNPDWSAFTLHRLSTPTVPGHSEHAPAADALASAWADPNKAAGELELAFRLEDLRLLFGDLPAGLTETRLRLKGRGKDGTAFEIELTLPVDAGRRPLEIGVAPNPFNPIGTISFRTTRPGRARVTVHDPSGRRVAILLEERSLPAGYHDVLFDTRSTRGRSVPSGVYFVKISAAEGESRGRFIVLK